jgi:hypothetical protein
MSICHVIIFKQLTDVLACLSSRIQMNYQSLQSWEYHILTCWNFLNIWLFPKLFGSIQARFSIDSLVCVLLEQDTSAMTVGEHIECCPQTCVEYYWSLH